MEFKPGTIPIERILTEDTMFKISTGNASAELVESIRLIGLLNPPILIACGAGLRIVSGFKRIAALQQIGIGRVSARILDPATAIDCCIRIAIIENSSQRSLNLLEQAHAIALLAMCYTDAHQLADAACSAGLSVNVGMADKLKKLAGMASLLKMGVLAGTIALPVAIQLHDMNDEETTLAIGTLLQDLGLSLNRQRELLEWIVAICRRDDITASQLLETEEIDFCMQDIDADRRQKGQSIRKYLKSRRYPTIQHHENLFAAIVNKLKLTKGTLLIAPLHFESPAYSLKFEFKNDHELNQRLNEFERIVKSGVLQSLWDDPVVDG
jgi:ParB family transcriptional regulator, chromosome partitioning protein